MNGPFLRKAWAAAVCCNGCGLPAEPSRSHTERSMAGSYLWWPGIHMLCLLKATYGEEMRLQLRDLKSNSFLSLIPRDGVFQGSVYQIPIPYGKWRLLG